MKKILVLLLAVTMLVGLMISGCQPKYATEQKQTTGGKKSDEPVTIRFIDVSPRPEREEFFNKMIEGFQKENENITIEYESVPWDDAANKLTTAAAANQLADVVNLYPGWMPQFVSANWILPLDDYLENSGIKDKFSAYTKGMYWADETTQFSNIYSIPDGLMASGIFVRTDWMEEAGLEYNTKWTWDDYFEVVEKLADPDNGRYGISYRGARGGFDRVSQYLISFTGGRMYDEQGNCLLYSKENVENFIKFTDMYLKGYAPKDSINWGFVEMVDNFTGGLTGTLNNDTEVVATAKERMEDGQWGVLPIPRSTVDGKIYGTAGASYSYGIASNSENPDVAWKFIEFLSRPENNAEYCKVMTLIPVRTDIKDDPFFSLEGPMAGFIAELNDPDFIDQAGYGPFQWMDLHEGPMHAEVQKYLQGKQTADEALKKLSDELTKRMKEHLKDNPGTVPQPRALVK